MPDYQWQLVAQRMAWFRPTRTPLGICKALASKLAWSRGYQFAAEEVNDFLAMMKVVPDADA